MAAVRWKNQQLPCVCDTILQPQVVYGCHDHQGKEETSHAVQMVFVVAVGVEIYACSEGRSYNHLSSCWGLHYHQTLSLNLSLPEVNQHCL